MVDRIHRRLGTAGFVIAIVALIAALGGGAYAASGRFSAKQKEEIRKIAKQFAGKPGAPGANGSAGANGKNGLSGLDGENGESGEAGADGRSVLVGETAPGCASGGITVEIEGSGEAHEICNGQKGDDGEPWTAGGTLPEGATETGSWSIGAVTSAPESFISEPLFAPLSFTIPISAALAGANVHYINPAGEEVIGLGVTQPPTTCTGNAAGPTAPEGELCVYASLEQGASETKLAFGGIQPVASPDFLGENGASTAGAALKFFVLQKGVFAYGTFAVTG